jgi:hypothetical protein
MLVTLSLGQTQSCKSFLYSGDTYYPLDWCANYGAGSGFSYSYDYTCDGTTVMYNIYTKSGCSGTPFSSTSYASFTTMVKCDGDVCDNVAAVKYYSTSTCAKSESYIVYPYVTGICVADTDTSYIYSCSGGNVTYAMYDGTACAGTATGMFDVYYNMECIASSVYIEVTCDASPDGGSSSSTISYNIIIYGLLFAATLVKLL